MDTEMVFVKKEVLGGKKDGKEQVIEDGYRRDELKVMCWKGC